MPSTTDTTGAVPRSAPDVCRARPELEEAHSPWPTTSRSTEHNTLVSLLAGRQGLHSEPLGNLSRFPVEMRLPQGCWPQASPLSDVCPSVFSSPCIGRDHSLSCHSLTEATAKLRSGLGVLSHSRVWLFGTLWTAARQAPLSLEFSRQEYWSGLPLPTPGDLPNPGIKPAYLASSALAGGFSTTSPTWEAPGPRDVHASERPLGESRPAADLGSFGWGFWEPEHLNLGLREEGTWAPGGHRLDLTHGEGQGGTSIAWGMGQCPQAKLTWLKVQ